MGRGLYRTEPTFRAAIDEILELASPDLGFDARGLVDPQKYDVADDLDPSHTRLAQPLIFAVEVATVRLLAEWGIVPHAQIGHSVGELAAAHLSGVLSLQDAVRVVVERGRLMQSMPPGAMLALALDKTAALAFEDDDCQVAAFNGPREHVISGSLDGIAKLEARLTAGGVRFTRLGTSHAFHHRSMQGAAEALLDTLGTVSLSVSERPFVSCMTGQEITSDEATSPQYWADSILKPVRFSDAARTLLANPGTIYIECGTGGTLGGLLRAHSLGAGDLVLQTSAGNADRRSDRAIALDAAGRSWAAGAPVRLDQLWSQRVGRKVSLPGYPFERERHWIDADPKDAAPNAQGRRAEANAYTRIWTPAPQLRPASALVSGVWLVLAHRGGIGEMLCARLRAGGAQAVALFAEADDVTTSGNEVTFDPAGENQMPGVVASLSLGAGGVTVVNTLTAMPDAGPLTAKRIREGVGTTLRAPLDLLRALAATGRAASALITVTSGLFAVARGEAVDPVVSLALGPARTLPQEVKDFRARIIDVTLSGSDASPTWLADRILAELLSDAQEPVIALRGTARLAESFAPLTLAAATPFSVARPGGTYLITGGFGGLGGVFARVLAAVGNTNIALVGRQGLGSPGAPSGTATNLVRELEAMGAVVAPFAADISDAAATARVVDEIGDRFGRIAGVVHAAGNPGGRILMADAAGPAVDVMAPKTEGALALISAVAAHQPDFVLLCSSFASISGGVGQGEYAAANAFLDALANWARGGGLNTIAVSWPAWRDVGMAHAIDLPPELEPMREASLRSGITPAEGADLFVRLVQAGVPHVVVAPFATEPVRTAPAAAPDQSRQPKPDVDAYRPTADPPARSIAVSPNLADGDDIDAALEARIAGVWTDVLGIATVTKADNFFELGGQSLMALQVVMRLSQMFQVELSLSDVLDMPTVGEFTAVVRRRLDEAIMALPDEEVRRQLNHEVYP
jgi:acyl transferase domain-containing protein